MENSIVLIGSVGSSEIVLNNLIDMNLLPDYVFSLNKAYSSNVSDFVDLTERAGKENIPTKLFKNINDDENIDIITKINPDFIFVVGLSQLVSEKLIKAAKKGVIGYHPTALPKFRGRAAIPWQILLDVQTAKSTLFFIDKGTDSGDIIDQEEYIIHSDDYADDVMQSSNEALGRMLKRIIPHFKKNSIESRAQNHEDATYLLKRTPEDGKINWNDSINDIYKLIRASSKPYPGAYSTYKDNKIIFWRAEKLVNNQYIGIPGQIITANQSYIDVFCKDGILRITEYEADSRFIVGNKFK